MQLLDFTFPFPFRNPFRPSSSSSLHYLLKAVFMAFPFDSVPKLKTLFQDFIFLFLVFPLCFAVAHPKVPRFSSWVGKIRWRRDRVPTPVFSGFPCGSAGKKSACNAGDQGSIPGLGRSPGEGKGYPLQYSGLENPMDHTVHGVEKSRTRLSNFWVEKSWTRLSNFHFHPEVTS